MTFICYGAATTSMQPYTLIKSCILWPNFVRFHHLKMQNWSTLGFSVLGVSTYLLIKPWLKALSHQIIQSYRIKYALLYVNYLSPRIFNGPCFKNYTQWQFLDLKKQTYFNFLVFVIAANKVRQKVFKYKISLHFRKKQG